MIQGIELQLHKSELADKNFNFQVGYLVFNNGQLSFMDSELKYHSMDKVSFLTSTWNPLDGVKSLPKPFIFGVEGQIEQYGDNILYHFIGNYEENIIILGAVNQYVLDHYDKSLRTKIDIENLLEKKQIYNNDNRRIEIVEDNLGNLSLALQGKGDKGGNIAIKVHGKGNHGFFKLDVDGNFIITQRDKTGKEINAQLIFDNVEEVIRIVDKHKNKIILKKDGTVVETAKIKIGKDETLKKILTDLLEAIHKMTLKSNTGATIPEPINWVEFKAIQDRIDEFMGIE